MSTEQKLDAAIQYLTAARIELQSEQVVVLEGFQHKVSEICTDIAALPLEDMRKYEKKLKELAESLRIFEEELRTQQSVVQQDIFALNRKQKGLQSYQTVSHSHKKDDD